MEILSCLNKDLLFEISKYCLYYDLRNLKFAFPEINLTEDAFLRSREETDKILYHYRSINITSILGDLFHSEYRDYFFKNISVKQSEIFLDIDCMRFVRIVKSCPVVKLMSVDSRFDNDDTHYLYKDKLFKVNIRNNKQIVAELSKFIKLDLDKLAMKEITTNAFIGVAIFLLTICTGEMAKHIINNMC